MFYVALCARMEQSEIKLVPYSTYRFETLSPVFLIKKIELGMEVLKGVAGKALGCPKTNAGFRYIPLGQNAIG